VKFFFKLYNYYLHEDKELARRLHTMIGFVPVNLRLFKTAFFHRSSAQEKTYALSNNERLEFLGDAILSTIVGEYLFQKYPNADEGFLTKMRSKIVKRNSLDDIGDQMGLEMLLELFNNLKITKNMLGNALEALIGAYYLECGYKQTKKFVIKRLLRKYLDIHELETYDDNYKSQLLEFCQKNGKTIEYKILQKYKSDKRDKFKVGVFIDGRKYGTADDYNKKSAEQTASERALAQINQSSGFDHEGIPQGAGSPMSDGSVAGR
jgi:ribonuclease III